jgi:hypothetical protein
VSAALLAAQRIQADLAGLTGSHARVPTAATTSPTEVLAELFHGESGSLGYLFDHEVVTPVSDALRRYDHPGPHGGAAHPDSAGQQPAGLPIGVRPLPPAPLPGGPPTPPQPAQSATGPNPSLPAQAADRARQAIGAAQERISGLFGG